MFEAPAAELLTVVALASLFTLIVDFLPCHSTAFETAVGIRTCSAVVPILAGARSVCAHHRNIMSFRESSFLVCLRCGSLLPPAPTSAYWDLTSQPIDDFGPWIYEMSVHDTYNGRLHTHIDTFADFCAVIDCLFGSQLAQAGTLILEWLFGAQFCGALDRDATLTTYEHPVVWESLLESDQAVLAFGPAPTRGDLIS